ncbi:MAG: ABC transporter substrate binding protein [Chloroflexota bacterium]
MNKFRFVFVTILAVAMVGLVANHNQTKSRVLIIQSYNTDFPWVPQVNGGIQQYLKENPSGVVLRYQYMDLRNHPNCDFYRSAANDARLVIQDWQPQVIIIIDDLGQSLVGVNYLHFKPGVDANAMYDKFAAIDAKAGKCASDPTKDKKYFGLGSISMTKQPVIIFGGVNGNSVEPYGYNDADNVTGIFENKNPDAIRQTIVDIYNAIPLAENKPTSIQILSDNSGSAASEKDFFENKLQAQDLSVPIEWKPVAYADTYDQWKQYVTEANQNRSMLLIANYGGIKENAGDTKPMPTTKLIAWTELTAKYPVLGAATNFITDGGMLTLAVPGYEQGQVAIQMALQVLGGTPVSEIKSVEAKQFIVGMNKSLVIKRGLNMPLIYEAFSRESNNLKDR